MDESLPIGGDGINFALPSYENIDHKGIMRFYVRECVEDLKIRKQLYDILRRRNYMDAFLEMLKEENLYEKFLMVCGDLYTQIFFEWAEENDLDFTESIIASSICMDGEIKENRRY